MEYRARRRAITHFQKSCESDAHQRLKALNVAGRTLLTDLYSVSMSLPALECLLGSTTYSEQEFLLLHYRHFITRLEDWAETTWDDTSSCFDGDKMLDYFKIKSHAENHIKTIRRVFKQRTYLGQRMYALYRMHLPHVVCDIIGSFVWGSV